jgi:hypothetical protein
MGLKNEGRQGPLKRVLFYPVFYPFEGRSALQRVVSEVVFPGGRENWDLDTDMGFPSDIMPITRTFC